MHLDIREKSLSYEWERAIPNRGKAWSLVKNVQNLNEHPRSVRIRSMKLDGHPEEVDFNVVHLRQNTRERVHPNCHVLNILRMRLGRIA